jgi:putative ABC transport system permease protein
MIQNFFKIAIRTLIRHKIFSAINILGLAIGMATCLLIFLYVDVETSYDKHHNGADRIYRVVKDFVNDDGTFLPDATTPPAIAPALQAEIPEIETVTRIFPGWGRQFYIRFGEKRFIEENVYRVDSSFFSVFTIPFIQGNPKSAFQKRESVVLTESAAKKYFGGAEPMGKIVQLDGMGDFEVTGVVRDVPSTSHFKFDFLISLRRTLSNADQTWGWYNFYTYIKLKEKTSIASVEPKIQQVFKNHQPENTNRFYTQALTDIHLTSTLKWELQQNGDKTYVYVMICIAVFVIIIASINYVNLATARSALRAKEIGVRKVSGAYRNSLIAQFLGESVITVLIAFLIATGITILMLPVFNNITARELQFGFESTPSIIAYSVAGATALGLLAGIYPALYLSSFKPILIMKGARFRDVGGFSLRKALVILQFSISIILITGILIISRQIDYLQTAKLGLNKDQVLVVKDVGYLTRPTRSSLKNSLNDIPGVQYVAGCDGIPGGQNWTNSVRMKGSENSLLLNFLNVDADFLNALSIPVKEGRGFSREFPGDTLDAIILNESAVKQLGIPEPVIGQQLVWSEDEDTVYYAKVVGIVPDFHFTSLRSEIKPFGFVTDNGRVWQFTVKLNTENINETLTAIESRWNAMVPERPFQYYFLDTVFDKLYKEEKTFKTVFLYGTALAIAIACMGLFALSAFVTEQRTKEIAIRKVIGSTSIQILVLLSKQFMQLVIVSFAIAIPLSYYAVNAWLKGFAYRIDIPLWSFAIAGVVAVCIALITVSVQTLKAATSNPVKSLRAE